jgi:hypothetical protein
MSLIDQFEPPFKQHLAAALDQYNQSKADLLNHEAGSRRTFVSEEFTECISEGSRSISLALQQDDADEACRLADEAAKHFSSMYTSGLLNICEEYEPLWPNAKTIEGFFPEHRVGEKVNIATDKLDKVRDEIPNVDSKKELREAISLFREVEDIIAGISTTDMEERRQEIRQNSTWELWLGIILPLVAIALAIW